LSWQKNQKAEIDLSKILENPPESWYTHAPCLGILPAARLSHTLPDLTGRAGKDQPTKPAPRWNESSGGKTQKGE